MSFLASYSIQGGSIEVICGPMFSGKTEELIRRVRRVKIAQQKIQVFKPLIDNRYSEKDIVTHSSVTLESFPVGSSLDILNNLLDSTRVVAIDEVQFFDNEIIHVVRKLARRGIRVICAGLDQDYKGNSFGPIADILAISDRVDKIQAVCTVCGFPATKTYRKEFVPSKEQVLIGELDSYEARCRMHFNYDAEEEDLKSNFEMDRDLNKGQYEERR